MINSLDLINQYKEFMLLPDPPQGFIMLGATKAAKWIDNMNEEKFFILKKEIFSLIENRSDKDLIDLIFVAQSCDVKDLKSMVIKFIKRGYGKDNADVKMYSNSFFSPPKNNKGVQIDSKWGKCTNNQIRGKKKKRGAKD